MCIAMLQFNLSLNWIEVTVFVCYLYNLIKRNDLFDWESCDLLDLLKTLFHFTINIVFYAY